MEEVRPSGLSHEQETQVPGGSDGRTRACKGVSVATSGVCLSVSPGMDDEVSCWSLRLVLALQPWVAGLE